MQNEIIKYNILDAISSMIKYNILLSRKLRDFIECDEKIFQTRAWPILETWSTIILHNFRGTEIHSNIHR